MNQLKEYIIALTNLYGLVHKNKVLEIYNNQNEDQISMSEVESILSNLHTELDYPFIQSQNDYFVHETILQYEDFDEMLIKKSNKPHYVPKRSELLNYVDDGYFEKSKQYNALLNYTKKNLLDDEDKAEWLCEEIL